jgi:hypothetical protein
MFVLIHENETIKPLNEKVRKVIIGYGPSSVYHFNFPHFFYDKTRCILNETLHSTEAWTQIEIPISVISHAMVS